MTAADRRSASFHRKPAIPTVRSARYNAPHHIGRLIPAWVLVIFLSILCSCGVVNLGKYKGIERTDPDEQYYLLKDVKLTGGLSRVQREDFDHTMLPSVNVIFMANNEKNHYVSKTTWYDPSGTEFRTIRQTHDKQEEAKQGDERNPEGTTRIHSIKTKDLYDHEPGRWKVELFLDDKMARRFEFTVR